MNMGSYQNSNSFLLSSIKRKSFMPMKHRIVGLFKKIKEKIWGEKKDYALQAKRLKIKEFQYELLKEIKEVRMCKWLLQNGKLNNDSSENYIDKDYYKTMDYFGNLFNRIDYYKKMVEQKNPIGSLSLTVDDYNAKVNAKVSDLIIDEVSRLNNNLVSYKYFLSFYRAIYGMDEKSESLFDLLNFETFKSNILMFLLGVDYDAAINPSTHRSDYESFQIAYQKNNQTENDFNKDIRNGDSHGDYYPSHLDNIIRVDSQYQFDKRYSIEFDELFNFIMNHISPDTRNKYNFLIKILNFKSFKEVINEFYTEVGSDSTSWGRKTLSIDTINKSDYMGQMSALIMHNIIQFNLQNHMPIDGNYDFIIDNINLDMFTVYDDNIGPMANITSTLSKIDILSDIKNAIGHGHIDWEDGIIIFRNIYRNKKHRVECKIDNIMDFLLQSPLHQIIMTDRSTISTYNEWTR